MCLLKLRTCRKIWAHGPLSKLVHFSWRVFNVLALLKTYISQAFLWIFFWNYFPLQAHTVSREIFTKTVETHFLVRSEKVSFYFGFGFFCKLFALKNFILEKVTSPGTLQNKESLYWSQYEKLISMVPWGSSSVRVCVWFQTSQKKDPTWWNLF